MSSRARPRRRRSVTSWSSMNRPWVTLRPRTVCHAGVVPLTVEVQVVDPAVRVSEDEATGRHGLDVRGHGLGLRGPWRRPRSGWRPSRSPPGCRSSDVVLPGVTVSRLVPEGGDLRGHLVLGALAEPDGEDDRGDPDHDAEHGEPRAQPVGAVPRRGRCGASRARSSRRPARPSRPDRPSRMRTVRSAPAATSASWVMSTIVRPASCSSSRSSMTSAADGESRAPVGSSARIRSGSVTSARAMATRCCWPPESSPGRCSTRSPRPTRSSAAMRPRSRSAAVHAGVGQRQLDVAPGRQRGQAG